MGIVKFIFIFFLVLYVLARIMDGIDDLFENNIERFVNLIEIAFGIIITFFIFKI